MIVVIIILIIIIVVLSVMYHRCANKEGFDAVGLIYNRPPEWFHKGYYKPEDWLVYYQPDQIDKPECMHYRGDPQMLNYMSSAYRFWRM